MADEQYYHGNGEEYNQEGMDVGGEANGNTGGAINASKNDDDERYVGLFLGRKSGKPVHHFGWHAGCVLECLAINSILHTIPLANLII